MANIGTGCFSTLCCLAQRSKCPHSDHLQSFHPFATVTYLPSLFKRRSQERISPVVGTVCLHLLSSEGMFGSSLEEGLINEQSPFCGTRQFGLCWVSKDGAMAKIGTTLQIQSHLRHGDGRLTTDNKGRPPRIHNLGTDKNLYGDVRETYILEPW